VVPGYLVVAGRDRQVLALPQSPAPGPDTAAIR